jgi:DNA invertase Pin-like site-specific DNA recombinase|tara:strand:- start:2831 stop:3421 length:591 start_codon:yes stop_codon:yes gene_type:complete
MHHAHMSGWRSIRPENIGYARVSTEQQDLTRQLAKLDKAQCVKVFKETASGKSLENRPALQKAIDYLREGDTLVIAEWDRATRSMTDGLNIIQRVADRGAKIKALDKPFLDLTTPMGKGILVFLSALAEDERERIVNRAAEGRKIAKAKGVKFGAKPKLTSHQRNRALSRMAAGDSTREIARDMGVHHSTISRLKK